MFLTNKKIKKIALIATVTGLALITGVIGILIIRQEKQIKKQGFFDFRALEIASFVLEC